jgi:hypothetical protein
LYGFHWALHAVFRFTLFVVVESGGAGVARFVDPCDVVDDDNGVVRFTVVVDDVVDDVSTLTGCGVVRRDEAGDVTVLAMVVVVVDVEVDDETSGDVASGGVERLVATDESVCDGVDLADDAREVVDDGAGVVRLETVEPDDVTLVVVDVVVVDDVRPPADVDDAGGPGVVRFDDPDDVTDVDDCVDDVDGNVTMGGVVRGVLLVADVVVVVVVASVDEDWFPGAGVSRGVLVDDSGVAVVVEVEEGVWTGDVVLVYLGVRLVVDSDDDDWTVPVDVDMFCGPSVDKLIGGRIVVSSDGVEVVDNEGPRVVILIGDVVVPLVGGRSVVMSDGDVVDDDGLRVVDVVVCDVVVLLVGGRIVVMSAREVVADDGGPRVDIMVCDVVVLLVVVETELGRRVDKRFGRVDVSCRVVVVVVGGGGGVVLLLLLPADGLLVDSNPGAVVVLDSCWPLVGMRVGMTVGIISVGIPVGIALKIFVGITLGSGDGIFVGRGDGIGDPPLGRTGLLNPVTRVVVSAVVTGTTLGLTVWLTSCPRISFFVIMSVVLYIRTGVSAPFCVTVLTKFESLVKLPITTGKLLMPSNLSLSITAVSPAISSVKARTGAAPDVGDDGLPKWTCVTTAGTDRGPRARTRRGPDVWFCSNVIAVSMAPTASRPSPSMYGVLRIPLTSDVLSGYWPNGKLGVILPANVTRPTCIPVDEMSSTRTLRAMNSRTIFQLSIPPTADELSIV